MTHKKQGSALAISLLASAICLAPNAGADQWALEEIIITAQKRAQSSQDVPIALSAFTGDMIKQLGATDFKGLTNVTPGFSVSGGSDAFPRSYIRGIGSNDTGIGADPSVGVYIDGIYASRNGGSLTDLMDIARVEILKGPQGTLFGRNSIGGAISIVTEKPRQDLSGELNLEVGNYNNRVLKGLINVPLIEDSLYMRASGSLQKRDGWQDNVIGGKHGLSKGRANGRIKFTWQATEDLNINFSNSWSRYDEMSAYTDNLIAPASVPFNSLTRIIDDKNTTNGNFDLTGNGNHLAPVEPALKRNLRDHNLSVTWNTNDTLSLSSLTSYRTFNTYTASDYDGTEYMLMNNEGSTESNETISQEFRLSGNTDTIDWFIGTSASHERNAMDFTISFVDAGALPGSPFPSLNFGAPFYENSHASSETNSYALFGDATWQATEHLNITFGARYSIDEKNIEYNNPLQTNGAALLGGAGFIMATAGQFVDANGNPDPSLQKRGDDWSDLSPRLVFDYAFTADAMVYASITKGYKSGGYNTYPTPNSTTFLVTPDATKSFDPELATNYELGIKSTWFEGRLLLNASLFSLDYRDLQVRQISDGVVQIRNAGRASNDGVELEAKYHLNENLTLLANASWMQAEYDEYTNRGEDLSGTPLLFSPNFSGNLALDYSIQLGDLGELRSFISYAYKNKHLYHEGFEQSGYGTVDARLSLQSEDASWEIALFGNNLNDKAYVTNYIGQAATFGFVGITRNTPRTLGASLHYKF